MFPANHDITPATLEAGLTVISNLLDSGNRVLVVSKPASSCITRICDAFADRREQILFRFTITARNPDILQFWEPGAPTYPERRAALEIAAERGFATSVSIEPMLDTNDVVGMVAELEGAVNHSFWIGKMNRIEARVAGDSARLREEIHRIRQGQDDGRIREIYETLKDNPLLRWKESIKQVVGLPLAQEPGLDR
jgi:DNA repair photolyase